MADFPCRKWNLRSVKFYEEAIPEEEEGLQPWPSEMEGYEELTTVIDGSALVRAVEVPENPEEDPTRMQNTTKKRDAGEVQTTDSSSNPMKK